MKRNALIALIGLAVFSVGLAISAAPSPNNCGLNMLCRVRTLIVTGDSTFAGDAGWSGSVTVTGNLTVTGQSNLDGYVDGADAGFNKVTLLDATSHAASGANAFVAGTGARACYSGASCGARWSYDGAFMISPTAVSVSSTLQTSGDLRPLVRLINSGTAATCGSNTGAVCVDDANGLAIADGNGTTNATVSAAGTGTFVKVSAGQVAATDSKLMGTATLSAGTQTVTVNTGALCQCTNTSATNDVQCSVTDTTLTITGTGTDVIAYFCPTIS